MLLRRVAMGSLPTPAPTPTPPATPEPTPTPQFTPTPVPTPTPTPTPVPTPGAPSSIRAEIVTSNAIQVTWSAVAHADGYQIWRKQGENQQEQIATTTNVLYRDEAVSSALLNSYYYWVLAFNQSGTNELTGGGTHGVEAAGPLSFLFLLLER